MKYEIDFIGINENSDDALASCFRWYDENQERYIVAVYDGGYAKHGEQLVKILNDHYFNDGRADDDKVIDFVFCSHGDADHASGLQELFEKFKVTYLVMNRPWVHSDILWRYVNDGRRKRENFENTLKEAYPLIAKLEELATKSNTVIIDGFDDINLEKIGSPLKILSPSYNFYIQQIVESTKTPCDSNLINKTAAHPFKNFISAIVAKVKELWDSDNLREDVQTSPENETSIVLLGDMRDSHTANGEMFLLTGDAGIKALGAAVTNASSKGINIKEVNVHLIPHHGGRRNVSTSILNKILGPIVPRGTASTKCAFVTVGKGSDHPREMVTNAYIRRGVKVYEARTATIWHHLGTPLRENWSSCTPKEFEEEVEGWED